MNCVFFQASASQTRASYPDRYECMSSVSVKRCPNLLTSIHEWKLTTRMTDLKDWFLQVPAFSHPNLHPGSPTRTSSKTTTVSYLTSRSWQITTSACKRSSEARVFACHNIKTSLCHDTSDGPTWNPLQVLLKSWELGITVHRSSLPKCRMPIHASIAGLKDSLLHKVHKHYTKGIIFGPKSSNSYLSLTPHPIPWDSRLSLPLDSMSSRQVQDTMAWISTVETIDVPSLVSGAPRNVWVGQWSLSVLKRSSLLKRRWNKASDHLGFRKGTELNYFHTSDISIRASK